MTWNPAPTNADDSRGTSVLAVLWDMDGTLVDTEPYWIAAEHALVESAGGTWTQEHAHQLVGNDLLVSARYIVDHSPVQMTEVEVVHWLQARVIADVRRALPWRPGARELLQDLRANGIRTALVTMSWRPLADAVVGAMPQGSFDVVVTGDEVDHGKPHPEPYALACTRLQLPPWRCIAVEDSATGTRSATAAGVPTITVPHIVPVPALAGSVQIPTLSGLHSTALAALVAGVPTAEPATAEHQASDQR
ncbi:MAG: HAD family hydrolase [Nostocoides sp.]